MKVGIMGGTFDPIHNGHLIAAEYAREAIKLDRILFMPSGIHPFKDNKNVTNKDTRAYMTSLAIKGNPYFELSRIGIDREDINYTIDDINYLRREHPDYEIYFIIGTDIVFEIEKWKDFYKLSRLCKFILFDRWGKNQEEVYRKIEEFELLYKTNIQKIKSPVIHISSTEIRNRVKANLSIKYQVPRSIENYIINNRMYLEGIIDE